MAMARGMLSVFLLITFTLVAVAGRPRALAPCPVTSDYTPVKFNQGFNNLWGPEHQNVSHDKYETTLWLDRQSGSGFSVSVKLQAGYTAGIDTSFYLSNIQVHPDNHDEIDIEFLGNITGRPYTLQTNIYVNSPTAGTGQVITGREERTSLSFDPTKDFHRYSILWTPSQIVFFVDDIQIRNYPRTDSSNFPEKPMWVYGSIWDASPWATENGKYKVDYKYEPFTAKYKDFILIDCSNSKASACFRRF